MKMEKQMRRIFKGELGQEALKGLERYGVEDLSKYAPWQLNFYVKSPLPWPQCEALFKQYTKYCSEHRFVRFDTWYAILAIAVAAKTQIQPCTFSIISVSVMACVDLPEIGSHNNIRVIFVVETIIPAALFEVLRCIFTLIFGNFQRFLD